jgi:hypothetical protein
MVLREGIKFIVDKTTKMTAPGNRRQAFSRNRRLHGCTARWRFDKRELLSDQIKLFINAKSALRLG